jgi:hypothetical protein
MEGEAKMFGGNFMDDMGQAFRYTPIGMASDAAHQGGIRFLVGEDN